MSRFKKNRYFNLFIFIFLFSLPLIVYLEYPLNDLMIMDSSDGAGYLAVTLFQSRKILSGEFAIWNKYISAGTPAAVSYFLYPFNILFGFLPPCWYVYVYYCFHIAVGSFFFYLFLREIDCSLSASLSVAVIYIFSTHIGGMRKSHMVLITAIVMLPPCIYFIQKYINTRSVRWLVLSSIPLALSLMGGHQQISVYIAVVCFFYLVVLSVYEKHKWFILIKNTVIWMVSFLAFAAVNLLPILEVMMVYSKNGSAESSYDAFASYSIYPLKLIHMIFPFFFGESYFMNFGNKYSSEMDIELFIGVIALILIIFGVKNYIKNIYIKIGLIFSIIAFSYMSIAHIPVLNKLVYKLPVFGNFRVPSRALFIFIFFLFTILAVTLTRLNVSEDIIKLNHFYKKIAIAGTFSVALFLFAGLAFVHLYAMDLNVFYNYIKLSAIPFVLIILIFEAFILLISKNIKRFKVFNMNYNVLLVLLVVIITLLETLSFSLRTDATNISDIVDNDYVSEKIMSDLGNYKVYDAFPSIDGAHKSIISQNKNLIKEMPAINSYVALNNPLFYRLFSGDVSAPLNYTGLMSGSYKADINVTMQNDLLSMLGVKYIIDSSHFIPDDGVIVDTNTAKRELVYESANDIDIARSIGGYDLWWDYFTPKPFTQYIVSLDLNNSKNLLDGSVFVDFYAEGYDLARSQAEIKGDNDESYELNIFSGDSASFSNIAVRVVSIENSTSLKITNFRIYELNSDVYTPTYKPYIIDEENRIFENLNVCDILYFSEELRGINNIEYIYENLYNLNMDRYSYVKEVENKVYDTTTAEVTDINFKSNSISARVNNEMDGFLNFSQCYFTGWNAYIDGKKVDIHMVNALIMGIEVPAGEHIIEFKYISISFIIGAIITIGYVLFLTIYFIIKNKKLKYKCSREVK